MDSLIESLIAGKYGTNPCVVKKVYASSLPDARENAGEETCWPLRVEEKGEEEEKKVGEEWMND